MKRIAVLLHEKETRDRTPRYLVWGLRDIWVEQGIAVDAYFGLDERALDADVMFAHVDLTTLPDEYTEFISRHPRVINGAAVDISKRTVSQHLVSRDDPDSGPVIVKTNKNAAGAPERRLLQRNLTARIRRKVARTISSSSSHWPFVYDVFDSVADVPHEVFADESLVVERFLPEVEDGLYCLRTHFFFGDRARAYRVKSETPIIKSRNVVHREEIEPRNELTDERKRLGLDFGKLDFVMHDGVPVLIDANKTPSTARYPPGPNGRARNEYLAPAIEAWLS
jgi:hypothetical protein